MSLSRPPLSALRAAVCVCAALPAALAAQNGKSAPRAMTKPDAEFEESFTQIAGVRELADGRVIVIDQRDKVVKLVDFTSGTMTQIGREGSGPNEYSLPSALLAIPGDTTLIYDPLNQRFLVVDPKGKPAGTFSLAQEAAASGAGARPSGPAAGGPGGPGGLRLGGGLRGIGGRPKGVDRQGRLYFLSSNLTIGPDGQSSRADSAPITRYDRGRKHTDTVAFIKMPQMNIKMPQLPRNGDAPTRITISATTNPFDTQDDWVVAPDGRIAVVRGETYRVDWIAPNGARTVGPAIPYDKIKITDADKRAWKEARTRGTSIQMRTGGPGGQTQSQAVNPRDIPDPTDWPEFKPPFLGSAATIAPDGTVWVARTQAAGAKSELYDVFDGRGQLVGRVTFPNRTRLVGFGKGVAYTVRVDEDDLQYLQRYKM